MIKYLIKKVGRYSMILVTCFSLWFVSSSQAPSVVYDPANASNIISLGKTMKSLKDLKEKVMTSSAFINNVLSKSNELKRLLSLLDNMVCATSHFNIYMGIVGDITACNKKLNIDITLSKLDGISGKAKSIMSGVYTMSQYESIKSLKDLNDELENSIRELSSINSNLRYDVLTKLRKKKLLKDGYKEFSFANSAKL